MDTDKILELAVENESDLYSWLGWTAAQKAEREKYQELIAAAEAVIEAAKRHGSVGYADRQMVYLQAVVERRINGEEE